MSAGATVAPAAAAAEGSGKGRRSIFSRNPWRSKSNSPRGKDGAKDKKEGSRVKKGRGRRPGVTESLHDTGGGSTAEGVDVGGGWILYADSDGHQYYWNEALQESR